MCSRAVKSWRSSKVSRLLSNFSPGVFIFSWLLFIVLDFSLLGTITIILSMARHAIWGYLSTNVMKDGQASGVLFLTPEQWYGSNALRHHSLEITASNTSLQTFHSNIKIATIPVAPLVLPKVLPTNSLEELQRG